MFKQFIRKSNAPSRLLNSRFLTSSHIVNSPRQHAPAASTSPSVIKLPINKVVPSPQPAFPDVRYTGPILYSTALATGIFITAGLIFDKNQQTLWDRLRQHSRQWSFFGTATQESILQELWREKRDMLIEKRQDLLESLARRLNTMNLPRDVKQAVWILGEKVASMSEAEKTLAGLIAINTVVFACWQIPRLAPFMKKWFLHLPGSPRNITLLTSCFSHQELFHFALNMVGLWSFGKVVHDTFGREQFVAMYLGIGIGANVVSHACSLALRNSRPLLPSLGASGAIYGLVASTAVMHPNSSISLIFLPMIPIKLGYALPALMSFDLAGVVLKWRMFDHYAHLAGASLGLAYTYHGERHVWGPLIRKIHEIREDSRRNGRSNGEGSFMWNEPRQPESNKWSGWFNR
ncbi:hypothetical protein [Parasitella parasitica]|uniref:Peptidase S54 rhomboid domain-containing protein n=1 Tax=Parasitella parasitica TaxID=35722 RepID=A0A0B7N2V3_9FUNG|nr:hypothetical protein [Parasitella parasitica]